MVTAALELHDAGFVVVGDPTAGSSLPAPSPGYALLDGKTLLTGAAAASRARLKPRFVHHRFWSELDTVPLGRPFPRGLTRADLAHAHLAQLWDVLEPRPDEVVLAVSGVHGAGQLGLMLGIARACGIPVAGIVDSATAVALHAGREGRLLHVDLHLHRAVVTELSRADEIVRYGVEAVEGVGLVSLHDRLARRVADGFVRETRFDPMHAGPTEQRLYDGLPHWMRRLREGEPCVVQFESGGSEYAIELTASELANPLEPLLGRLLETVARLLAGGGPATLLLPERAAVLPGLENLLRELPNVEIVELPETAAAAGALVALESIRAPGEELPFVTRLPVRPRDEPAGAMPASPDVCPTHVLIHGLARPIGERGLLIAAGLPADGEGVELLGMAEGISGVCCRISRRGPSVVLENRGESGPLLNGEHVEGSPLLAPGDRLRLGNPGIEVELIRVANDDGQTQG